MKKYQLTKTTRVYNDKTLYQIQALQGIPMYGVRKGALGGFIESEENLSQEGNCWLHKEAVIMDNARVQDDAVVHSHSYITDNAIIGDSCYICSAAIISDNAKLGTCTVVEDGGRVFGNAVLNGGQDGPYVIASSFVNFNISYGEDYLYFCHSYDQLSFSVSKKGEICLSYNFTGNYEELEVYLKENYDYLKETDTYLAIIKLYIDKNNS